MKLGESVRISWRSITGHKLRSTLTTLGVIIGIASVIVFMILGGAFEENIIGDIDGSEEPVMQVQTQTEPDDGFGIVSVSDPIYTESDVEQIEQIEGVQFVAPNGDIPASQLKHGDAGTLSFSLQATTPESLEEDAFGEFESGGAFDSPDEAVINTEVQDALDEDVGVGDEIEVTLADGSTETFTVSGVANVSGGGPQFGPTVYVSIDPHYTVTVETSDGTEERAYPSLDVRTEGIEEVDSVQESIEEYFQSGESDAEELKQSDHTIEVQTIEDALDQVSDIIDQLTVFIAGIAGISLVVGSIGIANIMIVSVTERTREIGIMKAVGGRKRDIVQLFLVESVILGAIGAALGVLLGIGVGYLLVTAIGWPMAYPVDWILIAVAVGVGVGILSGLYPAWSAARVDPIEALRRE